MKKYVFILTVLLSLLFIGSAFAQTAEEELVLLETDIALPVFRMVWNEDGSMLTLVSSDTVSRISVPDAEISESYTVKDAEMTFSAFSESGMLAALSPDSRTIILYEAGSDAKDIKTIEPGFTALSVSLSEDGTQVLADSAEEIRTVSYATKDGTQLFDLNGFQTAAPVYNSSISPDGEFVLWHSRGTFALQNIADGTFGKTISLWDFPASYELSPDSETLAIGIINDDYENGAVLFFDPESGEMLGRAILDQNTPIEISFNEDGSVLYAATVNTLYRIDTETFEPLSNTEIISPEDEETRISRIAVTPDGSKVAVLTSSGELILINE